MSCWSCLVAAWLDQGERCQDKSIKAKVSRQRCQETFHLAGACLDHLFLFLDDACIHQVGVDKVC